MKEVWNATCLEEADPFIFEMSRRELERQHRKIIMIASESICPAPVREALSSDFGNVYAEGYPSPRTLFEPPSRLSSFSHQLVHYRRYANRRYYKGCEYVDILESTLRRRTAEVFANERVSAEQIFVNTQPLSGAAANNSVYNAFVRPGDTVMGPSLTNGGHLTHGSEVNRSGIAHRIVPYMVARSGKLDYDAIEKLAVEHQPKLLIGGFSAYPWDVDWARMRAIADRVGAILLADIAHLVGMVAAGLLNSPVGLAHVVSFTTHKTLCGPRGAMLISTHPEIAEKVDLGVFPGEQGGPHIHQMAAKAVAMRMAGTDEFRQLQKQVLENTQVLAESFAAEGLDLAYGGTNTHMCLIDLRRVKSANGQALTGEIASRILDLCGIVCNKNTIFGDTNAIHPSGIRFGTTWVTQRGLGPDHMKRLAHLIAQTLHSIHPFSYIGGRTDWGRGKIDPVIFEEISAGVASLLGEAKPVIDTTEAVSGYPHFVGADSATARPTSLFSLHKSQAVKMVERDGWQVPGDFGQADREEAALREGTGLLDAGGSLILEIGQGRARPFLECVCLGNVMALKIGESLATEMLTPEGKQLARVLVIRQTADEEQYDRFLLKVDTDDPDRVLRWLRGLSDGYFLHDQDLWLKCEGPVVIEDLATPSADRIPLTCLGLRGPRATDVIAQALALTPPAKGQAVEAKDQDIAWILNRPEDLAPGFDLFVPVAKAVAVWSRLVEAGAQAVGCTAMAKVFAKSEDLPEQNRERALAKPFFVGQKACQAESAPPSPKPSFSWKAPEEEIKQTCLFAEHQQLTGAKQLVPFAGWQMPIQYSGILAEHEAVRRRAGLFDVSHMGLLEFCGAFAERFLDLVTTNYVPMLVPGQAHYSYLLGQDGRCIDDIIVYRLEPERFIVVVNAANAAEDEAWFQSVLDGKFLLAQHNPRLLAQGDVSMRNLKDPACGDDCRVDLAIQGPRAGDILAKLAEPDGFRDRIGCLRKFELCSGTLAGAAVTITRTGYTGEDIGFEIFVHPERAPDLWKTLLAAGEEFGILPTGLGARDSLRIEAGFPLHGHELAGPAQVQAIEAGYGAYVRLHKPFFVGRAAALEWHQQRKRTVIRFEVDQRGGKVIRAGNPVLAGRKAEDAGYVTSATTTPERQVGMALVETRLAKEGAKIQLLPITDHDKTPPARSPLELSAGDWMTLPRQATILSRFMKAGETEES